MIDMLHLTHSLPINNLAECIDRLKELSSYYTVTATQNHQQVFVFFKGGDKTSLLSLHLKPRNYAKNPFKIAVNPSHFGSFNEMDKIIRIVSQAKDLSISRIDHAIDLQFSLDLILSSLIYPRKRCREVYKDINTQTGVYYGNFPERLAIYDKVKQAKLKQKEPLTRVELRQYREKIPIKNYSDIHKYEDYKPFRMIKLVSVKEENLTDKEKLKTLIIRAHFDTLGAMAGRKELNKQFNFNRDYKSIIQENTVIPNLDSTYQKSMSGFFKGVN